MPASYPQTLAFLYGLQQHGIKLGLETIGALLARTGAPQRAYPSLHIAGTNGKGSTAAMAASVLRAAGLRVGLYTSPHLIDFRERIQIDGVPIPEERVTRWTDRLREAAGDDLSPTFFELTTAMAFHHFAEGGVDVAVLEVGMGGRFDATNVVVPVASAITNVARDHEEYLGRDLRAIAFEKAGVVKPLVPLVTGRLAPEAEQVIASVAAEREAPRHRLGETFDCRGEDPGAWTFRGLGVVLEGLTCPLPGAHQRDNAACALALCLLAGPAGLRVPAEAARRGLAAVDWPGRLEIAETRPVLLMDGAHNPAAAGAVADYLARFRTSNPAARVIVVLGMMRDKDHAGFFEALAPVSDTLILTAPGLPRAASVGDLAAALEGRAADVRLAPVPAEALALARRLAAPDDLICVTGSLMLVGEVKALLRGCGLSPIRG